MLTTLPIVLPIFALIFAGWLVRRIGILGPFATTELNRFVVYLALPALLFDIVAHARLADVWQPGFVAAFGLGAAVVFAGTVTLQLRKSRHLADAAIDGLNAGYANTGFIGFPLILVTFGKGALALTLIATILTVCVLFATAIALIEIGLQTERRPAHIALKVARSLIRNPLVVAPILAALIPLAGQTVPIPVESFLKLLGGAAAPGALVTLGLFLAEKRKTNPGQAQSAVALVALKLILQPAITWALARFAFGLTPLSTSTAVLLAALPTGTGPFMLAEFYRREATVTGRVVLVSTLISLLTVSACLTVLHH